MAALDDSLTNFEGQPWSLWADRIGLNSPASDPEDEENCKSRREPTTTRLKREDMGIYGYCPRWGDFYLVVCDMCGHAVKPQALKQHIDLRHGGAMTPVKSNSSTRTPSSNKVSRTRSKSSKLSPVVKLERRIDTKGEGEDSKPGNPLVEPSSSLGGEGPLEQMSPATGPIPPSPTELLVSQHKTEVKTEVLDGGLELENHPPPIPTPRPPPPPAPPEPPHQLPHLSPHTGPPPSVGPPSVDPASGGPPSIGPPSVGLTSGPPSVGPPCATPAVLQQPTTMAPLNIVPQTAVPVQRPAAASVALGPSSAEEEVNKISAMLQAEVEALTASQNLLAVQGLADTQPGLVGSHDIVEAQGLAGGSMAPARGVNSNNARNGQGVAPNMAPVNMSHMSMATLNQIQEELLATVSESDLNAVLNATPDATDMAQAVLPNSSQCYIGDGSNIQYMEELPPDEYIEPPHLSNQSTVPPHFNNDQISMPVLEQFQKEVWAEENASSQTMHSIPNAVMQGQYNGNSQSDMIEVPVDSFSFDEIEKISQCDELTSAVNSITQLCQQGGNSGIESQLAGLLQQTPAPAAPVAAAVPCTAPLASGNSIQAGVPVTMQAPNTQGLTVVIGAGTQTGTAPIASVASSSSSMPTLAATLKKPLVSTASPVHTGAVPSTPGSSASMAPPVAAPTVVPPATTPLLTSSPATTPTSTVSTHQSTSTSASTPVSNTSTTPVTPSPKKSTKKKKPGERKLVPLKDREYDPEVHCGVQVQETGKPCTRSLTCKTHSLSLRRAVVGRSKKFDELLLEHRAAKEALLKGAKPHEAASMLQATPPRGQGSTGGSGSCSTHTPASAATSPLLVKTIGGPSLVCGGDPSPASIHHPHYHHAHQPSHLHSASSPLDSMLGPPTSYPPYMTTPPSPAHWASHRVTPPLIPSDNFYVRDPPKPLSTCTYNARRLGGYLTRDHRLDLLRSSFRSALKKPHPGSLLSDPSLSNNLSMTSSGTQDRFVNVKPLLARKLQLTTVPSSSGNKDGLGVSAGYNGHLGIVNSSQLATTLKRPTQQEVLKNSATPIASAKNKNKKVKTNDGALNIVGNVLQLDTSGTKNPIPVVAVSLQNGISTPQTITLSNVALTGMRNSASQQICINPLAKSIKGDGSIRVELHSNTYGDTARLVSSTAKGGCVVASTGGNSTSSSSGGGSSSGHGSGQVTYLTPTVQASALHQVLSRLQGKAAGAMGGAGGALSLKLLGPGQAGVAGPRPTYVLHQEKEPS
ncbi:uncharacterized protein LOC143028610 isoform X1 [Oratosquilla oratoria]|uniref:uncharacterized protein LOC143028610 isoform X1 n=1 Tax=Oratosquilla oratoria TaxID=337810 RepID=UPI003F75BE27